ncbi:hypothetical protein LSH36_201g00010 [Paralvinella palmiformis]|uniref:Cyclic nucleotide-binding domain-containing protein n=1 Tax=Paralvinella palmiformis TaxID=53620 RepID=A0AAD9N4Z4_9ANNE|nr:hypothetical protein LSH36_201g00010 [Paralvinella palmiformis]
MPHSFRLSIGRTTRTGRAQKTFCRRLHICCGFSANDSGDAGGDPHYVLDTVRRRGAGGQLTRMGNGASVPQPVADGRRWLECSENGVTVTSNSPGAMVPDLEYQLKEKQMIIARQEDELDELRGAVRERDDELIKLRAEIHKLKSVLQVTVHKDGKPDILSTIQERPSVGGQEARSKKQGVSGESSNLPGGVGAIQIKHFDKDFRSKQLIKDAILDNDFLKNLDSTQIWEMVNCMYEKRIQKDHYIIKESEAGQALYVSAEGELEVSKDGKILGIMAAGRAFGELAILYNCTRTASVKALSEARIWVLDRRVFQAVMMKSGIQRRNENMQFLQRGLNPEWRLFLPVPKPPSKIPPETASDLALY